MKNHTSHEFVERYLYDVVRHLPEKQREDIKRELRTLIEDMIEEREESGEYSREECEKLVLNELGNPSRMARSYRGDHDALISGEYYDSYRYLLKIILICVGAGLLISNIISAMVTVIDAESITSGLWMELLGIGVTIPSALLEVFGVITLIFALLQRYHVKLDTESEAWSVEKLPPIPYKKALISRGESIVGIVFGILILVLFAYKPQLMGVWVTLGESIVSIPIFDFSAWNRAFPFIAISIMTGIISDLVKLIAGRYNYQVMITTIVMDVIGFVMAAIFLKGFPLWNADFVTKLREVTGKAITGKNDILTYFNTDVFTNGLLTLILFCFLIDAGVTVYYTLRYGNNKG